MKTQNKLSIHPIHRDLMIATGLGVTLALGIIVAGIVAFAG